MTKKTNKIKITLHNAGRKYEAEGNTVDESVRNLRTPVLRGHCVLVLEKGKLRKEKVLNAITINNVFGVVSPTTKEIAIKNLINQFNDFNK